jgi:hypothetical protein
MGTRNAQQQNDPALSSFDITPTDDVNLAGGVTRGLSSNSGGTVRILLVNDSTPVDRYMLRGVVYGWAVKQVHASGTDATHVAGWR